MGTKYPDLFAALAEPFSGHEVKVRTQAGRQLHYITARTAMNRLDDVLGPENWWDHFQPHENSVLCALTIRLPDGSTLTKSDAGGYAGMADSGDDDKSGYSDAFKRAAVKFGVARYLYRDGVPSFVAGGEPPARHDPPPVSQPEPAREYGAPKHGGALFAWAKKQGEQFDVDVVKWLDKWGQHRNLPKNFKEWAPEEVTAGHQAAVEALNRRLLETAGKSQDQE